MQYMMQLIEYMKSCPRKVYIDRVLLKPYLKLQVNNFSLSRGEICAENFIPPANGASLGSYFCVIFFHKSNEHDQFDHNALIAKLPKLHQERAKKLLEVFDNHADQITFN